MENLNGKIVNTIIDKDNVLKENYANEQVFIRLYGFGLTNTMVYRLYEVYGVSAANKVEENPYILLGFKENVDKKLFQLNKKTISLVSEQKFNTV